MNDIKVDNSIEPGAVDVKTEDLSGIHYPWMKVTWGAEGAIPVPVSNTDPLPIAVNVEGSEASTSNPLPVESVVDGSVAGPTNPLHVEALSTIDMLRNLLEVNAEMLNQLKIMNAHYSEWDGEDYDS